MPYLTLLLTLLLSIPALAEDYYKDGSPCNCDSIFRTYYKSGKLKTEHPKVNKVTHGVAYSYDEDGKIDALATFSYGHLDRIEDNTHPRAIERYKNSPPSYKDTTEYPKNKKYLATRYKDGTDCKCDHLIQSYWDNGNLKREIPIVGEDTLGWVIHYRHTGEILLKARYNLYDQVQAIEYLAYSEGGTKIQHRLGVLDTSWYDDGQVRSVSEPEGNASNYICDSWRGRKFTDYYRNGKIKKQRSDLSSKCVQTDKSYYEDGKLAGIITFKNYEMISNKCTDGRHGNESLDCTLSPIKE